MIFLKDLKHSKKLFLIAGPCVIESESMTLKIAEEIKKITSNFDINFIFKASYEKANRSSLDSFTGPGIDKGLKLFKKIKDEFNVPILTDVHTINQIEKIQDYIDIIQIPAFLCRQTKLLTTAAKTNKYVNVKKGPFLSGESCKHIINKIRNSGNNKIIITERGNSFGYENLVVDMRNIPIIKKYNVSVCLDATHSNQKPNQISGKSGGTPEYIETIALSGIAAGADGVFLETHPNPQKALCDGSNMLKLNKLENLLEKMIAIKKIL